MEEAPAFYWAWVRVDGHQRVLGVAGSVREAPHAPLPHLHAGDRVGHSMAGGGVLVIEWRNVATLQGGTVSGGAPAGNRQRARA
jgi:hypothetical protein